MVGLRMGEALEQAIKQIPLPIRLLETINDILQAVSVAKFVMLSENATKTEAEWLCKEGNAITHRLLSSEIFQSSHRPIF
jgi:hypothetical protein